MRTRTIRTTLATFAVAAVAAGTAYAAGFAGDDDQPDPVQLGVADDAGRYSGGDDASSPDPRPTRSPEGHNEHDGTHEDRPLRSDVREDDGRREVRTEVDHVGIQVYRAATAGTVTVARDGATLSITDVNPAEGWSYVVERSSGYEVEVTFRSAGERIDFAAEIEHDRLKIRVRER
jgi:hypothetical protein